MRSLVSLQNTAAGEPINESTAFKSPTFYAAVSAISRTLASLPLDVIRTDGDESIKDTAHPLYKLLVLRPNEWQSRYEYWATAATSLLVHNVFYAYKNQAPDGRILNLHPLQAQNVKPIQNERMELTFEVQRGGVVTIEPQSKIHRVLMLSMDGVNPISPLDKLRESLGLEIAAEKFGAALFEGGAIPKMVIKRQGHFKDTETYNRFIDTFMKAFKNKKGTAVLEDGFDLEKLQMSAEESQFLETRKLQRSVIAGALNISPHRVGDLGRMTFNNVEQLSMEYVTYTILPFLLAIETSISRDLMSESESENVFVKFNVSGLLRGDSKSRQESLKIQREWGIINANEWREFEDMNPIDGDAGEMYLRPLNYTSDTEASESTAPIIPDPGDEE